MPSQHVGPTEAMVHVCERRSVFLRSFSYTPHIFRACFAQGIKGQCCPDVNGTWLQCCPRYYTALSLLGIVLLFLYFLWCLTPVSSYYICALILIYSWEWVYTCTEMPNIIRYYSNFILEMLDHQIVIRI